MNSKDSFLYLSRKFFPVAVLLIAACGRTPLPTQQFDLLGVHFNAPADNDVDKTESNDVALFQVEGIPGAIRSGRLSVLGKDYGTVTRGDEVTFAPDGTFTINNKPSKELGLSKNAIDIDGVIYIFDTEISEYESSAKGVVTFEDVNGKSYRIEEGELFIDDEFKVSEKTPGIVVRVSADGSVNIYL